MKDGLGCLGQIKVTVPVILLGALFYFGYRAEGLTLEYLDRFFFTDAQAEELESRIINAVDQKIAPVTQGLKVLILANIAAYQEDIRQLKYIRDYTDGWTQELDEELDSKETSLKAQRDAMSAILEAENR